MKVKISHLHVNHAKREEGTVVIKAAASVVVAGILFAAAVEGAGLVNSYKKEQLYDQVMAMESQVWGYYQQNGRWPGDCNKDGVIGYQPPHKLETGQFAPQACTGKAEGFTQALGDLQQLGMESGLQKKVAQGELQIGSGEIAGQKSNAIVSYDVPVEVAQWLDIRIDGLANASDGRLRIWGENADATQWDQSGKATVTVAYYFDKSVPNS
ncbi:MAG: hypothetical protein OEW58_08140 [Gammaproteobacteria bacterium]|nr:hypothetical protein [Gammaproteobacteria bacterium]